MNKFGCAVSLTVLLMIAYNTLLAGGREITIATRSGQKITGELLSARPNELLLSYGEDIDDALLAQNTNLILRVPAVDIETVRAEGHSNVLIGMAIGTGVGLLTGEKIAGSIHDNGKQWDFSGIGIGIGLIFVGLVGGTIVGAATSSGDIDIEEPQAGALMELKSEARYSLEEPSFLKKLQ
ncbi:MAG: hypothetical protein HY033_08895 [Ignavibacteriae bacterium]|nr:hypothetical protein [Ignavibacteria bacterium]MBI3365008.1 hypothetical protein [Ignavibacteriota bacterium]